jgi:hypothetical protein
MDLHDGLLDHPKFIRAVKRGGSEAVHLWLGLRQYVAQQLSDGFVPDDMLDDVRGPEGRRRAAALQVLKDVGLVDEAPGGVMLHDFLQWSKSRDVILAKREANRLRQEKSRANPARLSRVTDAVTHASVTPLVTTPSPLHTSPHQAEESGARAHTHEGIHEPDPGSTTCPLSLLEKAESVGIIGDFVEKYSASAEQIREVCREFVSYWTIGGGMGRKHANWPKKLREHIRKTCERPGGLAPPGALEHAKNQPKRGRGGSPAALGESIPAPYHEAWKEPDWMKS